MMFDPDIFYSTYLDDYHKMKVVTLKNILDNLDGCVPQFFEGGLNEQGKNDYKKTIQADLRQTYFHAIETFFELFFALDPTSGSFIGDKNIMIALTRANWRESYKKINKIVEDETAFDFLDVEIEMHGIKVSLGHYIFYYGIADKQQKIENFEDKLQESLNAIKYGIRLIARDFSDRDEYNCYKHGLRIIPALREISLADPVTLKPHITWDIQESMSFFVKTKFEDEVKIVTKIFDSTRDVQMAYFCSNMISNMVYYRNIAFQKEKDPKKMVAIQFFGKEQIENCDKENVEIQSLTYTLKRVTS